VITGYLLSGRIVYIVYIFFLLRKEIVQRAFQYFQKLRAFQYAPALVFSGHTTKANILGRVPLPHFENSIPEPTPFLASLRTTIEPSFIKLGSNLYMKLGELKNMKLWGLGASELAISFMTDGLGIKLIYLFTNILWD